MKQAEYQIASVRMIWDSLFSSRCAKHKLSHNGECPDCTMEEYKKERTSKWIGGPKICN